MHPFVRQLVTEWRRLGMPFQGETIIAAVSGGADSVSLILALNELRSLGKLKLRFVAAHFNHNLRDGESDADEEWVRQLTSRLKIEFAAGRGTVPTDGNMEQNARRARYDFLRQTASNLKAYAVVTGHTMNDQAETVLMNLVRGSGPDGLAGMRPARPLTDEHNGPAGRAPSKTARSVQETLLVRPLLAWAKRTTTEAFCRDCNVEYRYDTMNEDTAFKRVRIRKILLPLLEDMNPNIVETLSNTATLMQKFAQGTAAALPSDDGHLYLNVLRGMDEGRRGEYIRSWLVRRRGTSRQLQLKHIRSIEHLALSTKSGRTAEVPGGRVVKSAGKLTYVENQVENKGGGI